MPVEFDKCRAAGGKIRTVKPKPGRHMPVCIRPSGKGPRGGTTVAGHVKRNKGAKR